MRQGSPKNLSRSEEPAKRKLFEMRTRKVFENDNRVWYQHIDNFFQDCNDQTYQSISENETNFLTFLFFEETHVDN